MFFETFTGKNEEFYFNLQNNSRVLVRSESYKTKVARDNWIESVKINWTDESKYSFDENNFTIKAWNGQIIWVSTIFSSPEEVKKAMKEVQNWVEKAPVQER